MAAFVQPSAALAAEGISVGYASRLILEGVSLAIPRGKITALIGPNGSGKSTLLKALGRILPLAAGQVSVMGQPITQMPAKVLARTLSLLPQGPVTPEGISLRDLVGHGRFAHQGLWGKTSQADLEAINRAIRLTGLEDLADQPVEALSGGQRQRAWIAMVAAQEAEIMLLDEPTTYLDVAHQIEILTLLERLNQDCGQTVVMVLHDLNLAARHADHIIALRRGQIVAEGPPEAVITPAMLEQVFEIRTRVMQDPETGRPWAIPLPLAR